GSHFSESCTRQRSHALRQLTGAEIGFRLRCFRYPGSSIDPQDAGIAMAETAVEQIVLPEGSAGEVFRVFLRLGLTSFGGPIAHLGYFHEELVVRRKWLDEKVYADLVALSQFLPGPASSKVGIAAGLSRAGYSGALAAWAGFTLPSA